MYKRTNFLTLLLLTISLTFSCRNNVEIIITDANGRPSIGEHIYITSDDVSAITDYMSKNHRLKQQFDFKIRLMRVGLTGEEADKRVVEHYNSQHDENPEWYPPYITEEEVKESRESYFNKWMEMITNWDFQGTTNALGTCHAKLPNGEYTILVGDILTSGTYYSFYVRGDETKAFKLK